jgi:hypothetical protein
MERKREFLQLAHKYDLKKTPPNGRLISIKYDGQRAFWDGGITRGFYVSEVPWANTEKDGRYKEAPKATGLWSRYGKAIQAPTEFLDALPNRPLDGELWAGPGTFQRTMSICGKIHPKEDEWKQIQYMVWDSPNLDRFLMPGRINNHLWTKIITPEMATWALERTRKFPIIQPAFSDYYEFIYERLKLADIENESLTIIDQEHLPRNTMQAEEYIEDKLQVALELGHEGVMIHHHSCRWMPLRTNDIVKHKPFNDAEATVKGYIWGRETDKGSKLLGLMGALVVEFEGKRLELSGFTNAERRMEFQEERDIPNPPAELTRIAKENAGKSVYPGIHNPMFPIGSLVTFKYRELSNDGIPKEARYWRKYS